MLLFCLKLSNGFPPRVKPKIFIIPYKVDPLWSGSWNHSELIYYSPPGTNKLASLLTLKYTRMPHLGSLHLAVLPDMFALPSCLISLGLCPNNDPIYNGTPIPFTLLCCSSPDLINISLILLLFFLFPPVERKIHEIRILCFVHWHSQCLKQSLGRLITTSSHISAWPTKEFFLYQAIIFVISNYGKGH